MAGGLERITTKDELIDLITRILGSKYTIDPKNPPTDESDRSVVCRRAQKIIERQCIHRNFSTLLWREGLPVRNPRRICLLLQGTDFKPELITICNGPSTFISDKAFFDVNPALFPANEFGRVLVIDGCVNVSNVFPNGSIKNIGSSNSVKYAIGKVAMETTDLWDTKLMFPGMETIRVNGTAEGPTCDSDSDSEGVTNLHRSLVVICQTKDASELSAVLLINDYLKSCDPHRGNGRWTSHLATCPLLDIKKDERDSLLKSRYFFQTPTSVYCTSSCEDNGVAIVQCASKLAFSALDILCNYGLGTDWAPIVLPIHDLFYKVIFKNNSFIPEFISTLRGANDFLKGNLFVFIRAGGVETRLTRNSTSSGSRTRGPGKSPEPPRGNFIIVAGLPVYANESHIQKWITNTCGLTIIGSYWGADSDSVHRLVIEIEEMEGR
jgi:hypothetical protein